MKRRHKLIIFIIVLAAAVGLFICACDGPERNKENVPVKPWQDYLERLSYVIDVQYSNLSVKKPVSCEMNISAEDEDSGDKYQITLLSNLDFQSKNAQQGMLRIERIRGEEQKIIVDIYTEDDLLYLSFWDEDSYEYNRVVYEHAPLMYTFVKALGMLGDSEDFKSPGLMFLALGKVFFTDGTVNAEKTQYTFDFDFQKGLNSAFSKERFSSLPEILKEALLSFTHSHDYQDLLSRIFQIKGVLHINLQDDKIIAICSDGLDFVDQNSGLDFSFKFDAGILNIVNEFDEDIEQYVPNASLYDKGRFTDMTANGKVMMQNSQSSRVEMQYDYEFKARIDILELIAYDGDIKALNEDNFFHLRVMHTCTDDCGNYCNDRYDAAKGAVIDVAFSPKDFGNYDIYISVGLRALIGPSVVSRLTRYPELVISNQIPEYWLAVVSVDNLVRQSGLPNGENGEKDFISQLITALVYEEDSLMVSVDDLLKLMKLDETTANAVRFMLSSDKYDIDTVRVRQDYIRRQVDEYDVLRSAVHLYGNDVAGTKQYTRGLISRQPALSYDYEMGGEGIVRLYNTNYSDGVLYDASTPICEQEIPSIVGSTVKAKAKDIYGEEFEAQLIVTGYSDIDISADGSQSVTLYCLPVGQGFFDGKIWESIRAQDWSKWLIVNVETKIKIDRLANIDFRQQNEKVYMQGEELKSNDTPELAEATLVFADDREKITIVRASNADVFLLNDYINRRYVKSASDTVLQFYLFGKYYGSKINVLPAKSVSLDLKTNELTLEQKSGGYSSELRLAKMNWTLADNSQSQAELPLDFLSINGYKIGETNEYFTADPTLTSYNVVFKRTGRYRLTYSCGGFEEDAILFVAPQNVKADESKYEIMDTTGGLDHYFDGYAYTFTSAIANSYHGQKGSDATISIQILRGYINSLGQLAYAEIENPDEFYTISEVRVDGAIVDLPCSLNLPPTIYGNIETRVKLAFSKTGYYKLRVRLEYSGGRETCDREIYIESSDI